MEEQGKIYDVTFLVCGTISLLVGGIVIMNILLASFNERVREVGTRKALGATGLNIMAQFLVESVVVTIFGGLLGVAVGGGFARVMSSLIQQPVVLTPGMMLTSVALLQENPSPTDEEIRWALSGQICRCTGYQNIVKAVQSAAASSREA